MAKWSKRIADGVSEGNWQKRKVENKQRLVKKVRGILRGRVQWSEAPRKGGE